MFRNLLEASPILNLLSSAHNKVITATSCKFYLQKSSILSFSSSSTLSSNHARRFVTTLTREQINSLLRRDELSILNGDHKTCSHQLPSCVKSLECNQLPSNSPIEDRLRISTVQLPNCQEPTLMLGVFDGHGGGTTADLISRRLFNYIALALHQERVDLTDLHHSPEPKHDPASLQPDELDSLASFKKDIAENGSDVVENLRASFRQCDQDLSNEIQRNLIGQRSQSQAALHYYLSAAVSGCCAIVLVLHQGMGYLASVGDCRGVLGHYHSQDKGGSQSLTAKNQGQNLKQINNGEVITNRNLFSVTELIEEHNCDNLNEVRRLTNSHPRSEQNSIIKQNRLLGHLMPFRAFGDYQYKWSLDTIEACGLTKAFGPGLVPLHYETPPYLIAEPDIKAINLTSLRSENLEGCEDDMGQSCIVLATDGLWELFESSRDVIESLSEHSTIKNLAISQGNVSEDNDENEDLDENSATYIMRSALRSSSPQDLGMNRRELKRMHHVRLEAMLTLPKLISRNFRDDISLIVLKFKN